MKKYFFLFLIILSMFFIQNVYAAEIKTGTYKIVSALDEEKILVAEKGNIVLGTNESTGATTWDVYSNGTDFYIKNSKDHNYAVATTGNKAKNKNNIKQYKVNNNKSQKWKINFAGGSYYYITSTLGNFNIDVERSSNKIGTNISLYKSTGRNNQKWKFIKIDEPTKSIEDGTYIIKSSTNQSYVFDLAGSKTTDKTNISLYSNNFQWNQVWNIKYVDGYYSITSYLDSKKSIDVYGGKFSSGTNVELYKSNNGNGQKFIIREIEQDTYFMTTYDGLWSIDIKGGNFKNGTNIALYGLKGSNAQKFKFEKVNIAPPANGYYTINSIIDESKVVGVNNQAIFKGKNVDLRTQVDHNYTKWYLTKVRDDIYKISNAENKNFSLSSKDGKTASGTNVELSRSNDSKSQKWSVRENSDGTYQIINVGSNKALDVYGAKKDEGTNIQIYNRHSGNAQKWRLNKTTVIPYNKVYDDGKYIIKPNIDQAKAIDINGASKTPKTNVQVYKQNSGKAQVLRFEYKGDGAYLIRSSINSNLVLTASSNNVISDKYNKSDAQLWYLEQNDKTTAVVNKSNGKYLNVDSSKPENYTNISLNNSLTDTGKFVLTKYTGVIKYKGVDLSVYNNITSWDKFAKEVDFAIIRAGFSDEMIQSDKTDKYQDIKYINHVENCEKYNIPYALYFYSYANKLNDSDNPSYNKGKGNSADSEAAHMLSLLKKITNKGYYPTLSTAVFYDQEEKDHIYGKIKNYYKETDSNHPKTKELLTNMINRFCSKMNNNKHKCGIYASSSWLTGNLNVKNIADKHSIWVAQWPGYNTFTKGLASQTSYTSTKHKIWQFSNEGSLNGVKGAVDLDIGYDIFE